MSRADLERSDNRLRKAKILTEKLRGDNKSVVVIRRFDQRKSMPDNGVAAGEAVIYGSDNAPYS